MLNKVILIGNVGKEPEVRAFPDTKVANLTLATTEKYKDKQGNPRTVSMGAIIELITAYGYDVEITAKKKS